MTRRTALLAAAAATLLAGETGIQLPNGRWYSVDNCRSPPPLRVD